MHPAILAAVARRRRSRSGALFRYRPGDSGYAFSRASSGLYVPAEGGLRAAGLHELRDAHYGPDGVRETLLEGQRTNLVTNGARIGVNGAGWVNSGAGLTVTPDAATAPDGTQTATRLVVTGGSHSTRSDAIAVTENTPYRFTFYAKNNGGATATYSVFNVTGGANIVAPTSYVSQLSAGEYRRITVEFTTPAGCTSIYVYPLRDSGGTVDLFVWGAQLEQATFPSSPILTSGATATRAADALSFPFPHAPQAMTVYARFRELGTAQSANDTRYWHIGASNGLGAWLRLHSFGGAILAAVNNGAGGVNSGALTAPAYGQVAEVCARLTADGFLSISRSYDGGAEVAGAQSVGSVPLPAAWGAQTIWLNSMGSSNTGFAGYRGLVVLPGVRTLDECRRAA